MSADLLTDTEAEQWLVGMGLTSNDADQNTLLATAEKLGVSPDDFTEPLAQTAWAVIVRRARNGLPINLFELANDVEQAGHDHGQSEDYLTTCAGKATTVAFAVHYAQRLMEASRRRKLLAVSRNAVEQLDRGAKPEAVAARLVEAAEGLNAPITGGAVVSYYDQTRKEYLIPDAKNGWTTINETGLKRLLRSRGFDTRAAKGESVSEIDRHILESQMSRSVCYAGPVAGYQPGLHEISGGMVLVTAGPKIIQPDAARNWDTLRGIIQRMLGDEQATYFFGWLKIARAALQSGCRTPGQALAIAGPKESGKSLLQNLVTLALGGRAARPYQFMSGLTPFNAHLFGAEHLMVEDEQPCTDHKARRAMGAMIKSLTVNEDQSCHRKGATPVQLRPFWRLSITVNDEPENLMVLPPLDESLEDKIILLRAAPHPMPIPTAEPVARARFWNLLVSELPGLLAHVEAFEIPPHLVSQRFGIRHYQHPGLMFQLDALAPESKLLSIIDDCLLVDTASWTGTAAYLERCLTDSECRYANEARKLLSWPTACGTYLGRLRRRYPSRIEYERTGEDRERIWTIRPADSDQSDQTI